jgi:single-stranded-DNA-specific exonuclease
MLKLKLRAQGDTSPLNDLPIAPSLKRVLVARGVCDPEDLNLAPKALLPADQLMGIDVAVDLISAAIDEQKRLLICGDFDCDGATSTALMVRALSAMGAVVDYLVPDRFVFGYGLTPELVDHAASELKPDLIITVDNGISSTEGVNRATELGIEVIITDHHLTTKPTPKAAAVVNPNQLGCQFPSKALAGVGVAFYLLGRLAKQRALAGHPRVSVAAHLDLVALGTVADVASLDTNNRILVEAGLKQINRGDACPGIRALLQQAGRALPLTARDLGFTLGPRLNAAGRMAHMHTGIECLLSDEMVPAANKARELEAMNLHRREVEADMRAEAGRLIEESGALMGAEAKRAIVVYDPAFHQGVIGIVAGRLKQIHHRPSFVFAPVSADSKDEGLVKASARSIEGVHIRDLIERIKDTESDLIHYFGGHAMAAGLTMSEADLPRFEAALERELERVDASVFEPVAYTDGELSADELSLEFAAQIEALGPWGQGFVLPQFDGVFEVADLQILKEKHLKLWLVSPAGLGVVEAIWFNFDHQVWAGDDAPLPSRLHLLYEPQINRFRGKERLQLMVLDAALVGDSEGLTDLLDEV